MLVGFVFTLTFYKQTKSCKQSHTDWQEAWQFCRHHPALSVLDGPTWGDQIPNDEQVRAKKVFYYAMLCVVAMLQLFQSFCNVWLWKIQGKQPHRLVDYLTILHKYVHTSLVRINMYLIHSHFFLTKQILGFCIKMCVYVKNKISKYIVIIFF